MDVRGGGGEDVYASLLLTDSYLPGALVLAHSLRDAGTTKKLAILVTIDTVSADVITQLKAVYDYVIPVSRIRNDRPANLYLMNRPDLHSAFTKINLWKQTQFRRVVYLDADVVAYRAPDELFDLPHAFAAAPDIGWPDLFNTGVMALTPNKGDYYAMMAMAERGISFDGADQGLLNMHFKNNYHRLSFTYNVTPSAHYQYIPAYMHFQSSINMVHFIGSEKPWQVGRGKSTGSSPFDEMVGRWWAAYDRHYRIESPVSSPSGRKSTPKAVELVQYLVKGEYQPQISYVVPIGEPPPRDQAGPSHGSPNPLQRLESHPEPHTQHQSFDTFEHHRESHEHAQRKHFEQSEPRQYHHHHHHHEQAHEHHHPPPQDQAQPRTVPHVEQNNSLPSASFGSEDRTRTEAREEQETGHPPPQQKKEPEPPKAPPMTSWDAQWHPPPADSQPEAANFPQTYYEMSSSTAPFVPPERYPSPPKNMWYEVPKEAPAPAHHKPAPIFPWERHQPPVTRVFGNEPEPVPESPVSTFAPSGERKDSSESQSQAEPSLVGSFSAEHPSEPQTPVTPTIRVTGLDPWTTFTRTNAWDDVPEIDRYVSTLQKRRVSGKGLKLGALPMPDEGDADFRRDGGFRVTEFPSEVDRPSLPVTPAPIRRPKFWGGGAPGYGLGSGDGDEDDGALLPAAEGVPAQSDWDPVAQLQKLARQQSELLLQKLGGGASSTGSGGFGSGDGGGTGEVGAGGRDTGERTPRAGSRGGGHHLIPSRPMPFGSETAKSPTYVGARPSQSQAQVQHHNVVLSPQPRKPSSETSSVRNIDTTAETTPSLTPSMSRPLRPALKKSSSSKQPIRSPSYSGPGIAFEKGEDVPIHGTTPARPSEEEKDVLET